MTRRPGAAEPHAGHLAVVEMEARLRGTVVVTQNVDDCMNAPDRRRVFPPGQTQPDTNP